MAQKYLINQAGAGREKEALVESLGAASAGAIPGLGPDGLLHPSTMPVGVAPEVQVCPTSEAVGAGQIGSFWNDNGVLRVRLADATGPGEGKRAHCYFLQSYGAGQDATCYLPSNRNTALTGLTPATTYFLSTTPGGIVSTPPSGAGNIVQEVGYTTTAGVLVFMPSKPVELA